MKKLIMGIGIAGSGKTTILKDFAKKYGYKYISSDDIRKELTGNAGDQSRNQEVWDEARKRTQQFLKENNVVFDATFSDPQQRKDFLEFAKKNGAREIQGVYVDVPLGIAKERNRKRDRKVPEYVIDRMEQSLRKTPPQIEEGFDAIFKFDEYQKLVEAEKLSEKKEGVFKKEFRRLR